MCPGKSPVCTQRGRGTTTINVCASSQSDRVSLDLPPCFIVTDSGSDMALNVHPHLIKQKQNPTVDGHVLVFIYIFKINGNFHEENAVVNKNVAHRLQSSQNSVRLC